MASGPDDERRQPSEPTFADVMNGFTFDAGRSPRRRRWGRRRDAAEQPPVPPQAHPASGPGSGPTPNSEMYGYMTPPQPRSAVPHPQTTGPIDMRVVEAEQLGKGVGASAVRPYTWTRGRTKSGLQLAIETLVSTSQRGRDQMGLLQVEWLPTLIGLGHPMIWIITVPVGLCLGLVLGAFNPSTQKAA